MSNTNVKAAPGLRRAGKHQPRPKLNGHVATGAPLDTGFPQQSEAPALHQDVPAPKTVRNSGHKAVSVSLVIPAKNEALNIAWVLEQVPECVDEIILVDGNSTDVTVVAAQSCRPDIRVITQQGSGKGWALRTGFLAATGDVIVMMDADGSMAPQEITHYLYFLANGYDFVKGSRFICGGGSLDITRFRKLGNRSLLAVFNRLYGAQLTDLCYGFCAFHRRYLPHLNLASTGFEIEAELTVHAMHAGLRIAEVPSVEMPRRAGRSNLRSIRDGIRVLRTVLREHRAGITGRLVQSTRNRRRASATTSIGAVAGSA
jgi:glycosyltransferase involved in cell wall biosynthesis